MNDSLLFRKKTYYYEATDAFDSGAFARQLTDLLNTRGHNSRKKLLFLCIGSERIIGDSLGPIVGHRLKKMLPEAEVLGCLGAPVHALNLELAKEEIRTHYPNHTVIAIDASLGNADRIGYVTLCNSGLKPGLGVAKKLPGMGDISITGVVGNCYDTDSEAALGSADLSVVIRLADAICDGVAPILASQTFS